MSLTAHWFLPTYGDSAASSAAATASPPGGRRACRPADDRLPRPDRPRRRDLGFEGALTPTGAWCEDAWLTTAMLVAESERLKFLVAFRPGVLSPTLAAQMAATFQRHSQGRLLLNVVTGGEPSEQRAYGDYLGKDDRYTRTGEFLDVVRRLWAGETVTLHGEHIHVDEAALTRVPDPVPPVYFGGSSPAAGEVAAAQHVDVYLTWGEPPDAGAREDRAGSAGWPPTQGRELRFGIRLHVITRDTSDEAWAQAEQLPRRHHPTRRSSEVQAGLRRASPRVSGACSRCTGGARPRRPRGLPQPVGGRRAWCAAARGRRWSAATTEVADRIAEYHDLGITSSSCPATRTWRRRTGSARASCPSSGAAGCGATPPVSRRRPRPPSPSRSSHGALGQRSRGKGCPAHGTLVGMCAPGELLVSRRHVDLARQASALCRAF